MKYIYRRKRHSLCHILVHMARIGIYMSRRWERKGNANTTFTVTHTHTWRTGQLDDVHFQPHVTHNACERVRMLFFSLHYSCSRTSFTCRLVLDALQASDTRSLKSDWVLFTSSSSETLHTSPCASFLGILIFSVGGVNTTLTIREHGGGQKPVKGEATLKRG